MNGFRIILLLIIAAACTLVLIVTLSGVELTIENRSNHNISNIEITYRGGSVGLDELSSGEIDREFLGKIGEGSEFDISWVDSFGVRRSESFFVYFVDFDIYTIIEVKFTEGGVSLFYKNDEKYIEPAKSPNKLIKLTPGGAAYQSVMC